MMTAYATKTQPTYRRHAHPALAIATPDRTYEVFRPAGALEEHIAYACGKREDIEAFYAAQTTGTIRLRELTIKPITAAMAQQAINRNLKGIMRSSIDDLMPAQ